MPKKSRILVVEDEPAIAKMLGDILVENGYDAEVCLDGGEGLQKFEENTPDLVLLDLLIPTKNGFDILSEIRRKDAEFGLFVPVIILTGVFTSRNDKIQSLNSGADDFLQKPFDLVELLARVKSLLRVKDLYQRSQYLATHDQLTGCYNRRHLLEFLERENERYKRYKKPFTYLLLDMDHFKEINDQCGHEAGDSALQYVGQKLKDFFRSVDCVARLGGDEFSVVLPDCDPEQARQVGGRLMEEMAKKDSRNPLPKEFKNTLNFSVGMASVPDHAETIEQVMKRADEAMYEAKKAGRNQYKIAA